MARWPARLSPVLVLAAAVVVLTPAWLQLGRFDRGDSAAVAAQRHADGTKGAQLDRLIAVIKREGGGRAYAGMPGNWGTRFTVGAVPVFKYLESRDVDEVGYTLRTASLMTNPEDEFDEHDPSDYRLFGIRYLILPAGRTPPVPAQWLTASGHYVLWTIRGGGYIETGTIVGQITANRRNLGAHSLPLLRSDLAGHHDYLAVRYGRGGGSDRIPTAGQPSDPGTVLAARADLSEGEASATVRMRRPGVAVLSASYDPGWTATVDGRRVPIRMVAPALVAVDLPAGTSRLVFRFHGYDDYPELLALGGLTLAVIVCAPRWMRARRSGARSRRHSRS